MAYEDTGDASDYNSHSPLRETMEIEQIYKSTHSSNLVNGSKYYNEPLNHTHLLSICTGHLMRLVFQGFGQ